MSNNNKGVKLDFNRVLPRGRISGYRYICRDNMKLSLWGNLKLLWHFNRKMDGLAMLTTELNSKAANLVERWSLVGFLFSLYLPK